MPSCRFFATGADAEAAFAAVLADGSLRLFEQYSRPNAELRSFRTALEAADAYAAGTYGFTIHAPVCGGLVVPRRFALRAEEFGPGACRYQISGWGTLNLQFGVVRRGQLRESFLNHNSEVRALEWASTNAGDLGAVDAWQWPEVTRVACRVVGLIRRLGVARLGAARGRASDGTGVRRTRRDSVGRQRACALRLRAPPYARSRNTSPSTRVASSSRRSVEPPNPSSSPLRRAVPA
jgi:hypothetical protein